MHRFRLVPAALALGLVLVATACGSGDDPSTSAASSADGGQQGRVVDVEMVDIAFEPDTVSVERGETVTFRFTNNGRVAHDAFVGDRETQQEHEAETAKGAGDGHDHGDDANAIVIDPGETETLTYTFDDAGTIEIGCHQPGHYGAGMKIEIDVS